jgi:hypothetical protein
MDLSGFHLGLSRAGIVEDLILLGGGLLGEGVATLIGWLGSQLCGDGNCTNEVKSSYQLGQEGQRLVMDFLKDPTSQEEVWVWVGEAGKRVNQFALLDIVAETAIHEAKNVAQLSLSQEFVAQAMKHKTIADAAGLELNYWLLRSAPQHVFRWLRQVLEVVVHIGIPPGD